MHRTKLLAQTGYTADFISRTGWPYYNNCKHCFYHFAMLLPYVTLDVNAVMQQTASQPPCHVSVESRCLLMRNPLLSCGGEETVKYAQVDGQDDLQHNISSRFRCNYKERSFTCTLFIVNINAAIPPEVQRVEEFCRLQGHGQHGADWMPPPPSLLHEASLHPPSHTHTHFFYSCAWVRGFVSFVWMSVWRQQGKLESEAALVSNANKVVFLSQHRLFNSSSSSLVNSVRWKFIEAEQGYFGCDSEPSAVSWKLVRAGGCSKQWCNIICGEINSCSD